MKDEVQSQRVVSQGGLNTLNNYLTLSTENPGAAIRLQNFESSLSGGYRRINGFVEIDEDFPEPGIGVAEGAVLGLWYFHKNVGNQYQLIAARKTDSVDEYEFYLYTAGVGWTEIVTGYTQDMTHASNGKVVNKIRAEFYNNGVNNEVIFVDGVNPALVYNGTDWYRITAAGTGGELSPGGDQLIDAPSVVTFFKGHLLLSGDASFPGIVAHSAPNDSLTWTAAAGGGQLNSGFPVVQLKPFRDECFTFGESRIRKAVPDPSSGFIFQDVTTDLGCLARDSVLEIGGSLIFLSHDGIRPIAGTDKFSDVELGLLSQEIQDLIDTLAINEDLTELSSVVIKDKTQFRYFYSNANTDVAESVGILGCVRVRPQLASSQSASRWEFSTILGIRSNVCWSGLVSGEEVVIHGDYNGKVYVQETGNNFDGAAITAIYATPFLDMGDTAIRKTLRTLTTFIKSEGSVELNIGVRFDWGDTAVINPSNYTGGIGGGSTVYDAVDALYDDPSSVYGGVTSTIIKTNIQGSCFSAQYIFSTTDTLAPYTIHGFVQEFSVKGRQ